MVDAVVHGHLTDVVVASRKDPQFLTDAVVRAASVAISPWFVLHCVGCPLNAVSCMP